MIFKKTRNFDN